MSLIAIVHIAHPDLALCPTIRRCSEASIRVMPQATTDPETGLFFFHVENGGEALGDAFDRDPTVAEWARLSNSEMGAVYQLNHTPETILLSPKIVEFGGLIREATSDNTGWKLRIQFSDREELSHLWQHCEKEGLSFDLQRIFHHQPWEMSNPAALTDPQLDALATAHEEGYFEIPRRTSLEELAEKLGISSTAVGGRIRRGTATLVETMVVEE